MVTRNNASSEAEAKSLIVSYLTLRRVVGILGISLPFVLSIGAFLLFHTGLRGSISSYYHTAMRDVFVGFLFAIGSFLFAYQGYDRTDNIAGNLACVFAIGVAVFPTTPAGQDESLAISNLHQVFAGLFFLTLAFFSLHLFTKTDPNRSPTRRKLQRNRIYRACGIAMLACVILIALYDFLPDTIANTLTPTRPVYWLESVAIICFGVSWFTKGEAILKDN